MDAYLLIDLLDTFDQSGKFFSI